MGGVDLIAPEGPGDPSARIIAFGEFEIDRASFELRRSGRRVPIEPQAFDVLAYLTRHRDRVVSKEELMDQIWGGRFVTESAVTSRIKQARRATGDDGRTQRVIMTMHGRGYRFVAAVRGDPADDPTAAEAAEPASGFDAPSGPGLSLLAARSRVDSPEIVGRAEQLVAIDRALQAARAGQGVG
jgi:DNA-binding winged helix-turn-helix (wHTH) protein